MSDVHVYVFMRLMIRLRSSRCTFAWVASAWLMASTLLISANPHAVAEVGDPCETAPDCAPGEVCAPGRLPEEPSFCTRACRADRPCPEGYVCEDRGGLALCNTEVTLSPLGAPCGVGCLPGLICLDDGVESYCSTPCTLPGSCPEGYRCQPGALNACARITSKPSIGEPCDEVNGCLDALECLALPHRSLPYCTYTCAERACPSFMVCEGEGEEARCVHTPYERGLGDECVESALDMSLVGCDGALLCEPDGIRRVCTQDCTQREPCPEGFGCVYRPEAEDASADPLSAVGRCLPDVETDPELTPYEPDPPMSAGVEAPMTQGGVTQPPPPEMTSAVGDPEPSCHVISRGHAHGSGDRIFWLISLILVFMSYRARRLRVTKVA